MTEKNVTILVVDDDAVICTMLQAALEGAGYNVLLTMDGSKVLGYVEAGEPDLLLLDVMLDGISGIDVCRKIRDTVGDSAPPVIFITSLGEDVLLNQCADMDHGVDYLLKPFRIDVLLARVANTLALVESQKKLACKNEELAFEVRERIRLAALIEQFSDSVMVVENNGCISYANLACEKNSGYSPRELVGEPIWKTQHMEIEPKLVAEIKECVKKGNEWQGTVNNIKKDGSLYLEEIFLQPLVDSNGDVTSHVVIKKDVTERCRLESIASSVNLMDNVGFVFSGIRHELGNPVNSLKMTLSVLSKKIDLFSKEKIVEFLDRSQNEISRIEYLLQSLHSFSMFETPVPENILLPEFIKNVVDMHRKEFAAARIDLQIQIEKDAEGVYADPRALVQVLLNLFTNAMHAVEGRMQPAIIIKATKDSESLVCLSVEDNGSGISQKNKEMLFKPFYTTRAEGTGLGLVIVKKMLAEMDCSIQVESKEFEGTTFSILLPTCMEQ